MQPSLNTPTIDILGYIQVVLAWLLNLVPIVVEAIRHIVGYLSGLFLVLSLVFFIGIVYCVEGLKAIRRRERETLDFRVEPAYETVDHGNPALSNRWESVMRHIESPNQNDWKQAIIEADIILDEILTTMGYRGESVGEKLKRVSAGDWKSLNEAWEAHKVRNQIAHEGSSFTLNEHEARKVINMYKKVFEEFYYI